MEQEGTVMAECIEREAVMQKFADHVKRSNNSDFTPVPTWNQAVQIVEDFPAADVRPVVRGHWIGTKEAEDMGDIMKEFTCSVCGCCEWDCTESESFNFCPNCGADMREEEGK